MLFLFFVFFSSSAAKITSNILFLTESNFSQSVSHLPALFLMIYQGLSFDEKFRSQNEFLAAAENLRSRCYFGIMDGERNQVFVRNLGLKYQRGFYFYRFGKLTDQFSGSFTTQNFENFGLSKTGQPFTVFDDIISAQDFIESTENPVVLYLNENKGDVFDKFMKFSGKYRDNFSFGVCFDSFLSDELGIDLIPSLVLYRSQDNIRISFPDSIEKSTETDLISWLKYQIHPSYEVFQYKKYDVRIGLFFVPVVDAEETLILVSKISEKYFGENGLKIVEIDSVGGERKMTSIGFSKYAAPAFAIIEPNGKTTLYPEDGDWNFDSICTFIEQYLDNYKH